MGKYHPPAGGGSPWPGQQPDLMLLTGANGGGVSGKLRLSYLLIPKIPPAKVFQFIQGAVWVAYLGSSSVESCRLGGLSL